MAVDKVAGFAVKVANELDITFRVINLGGGFGIRYVEGDTPLPISQYVKAITDAIKSNFTAANYPLPEIWVEPGRSMVGDAGTTLYTVGTSKDIPGVRKYIAVDGGMTDNPRPALYESKYEAVLANRVERAGFEETVSVAGKCCESGDMLIMGFGASESEAAAICLLFSARALTIMPWRAITTGFAVRQSYSSKTAAADFAVKRESLDDIVGNDVIPARLQTSAVK